MPCLLSHQPYQTLLVIFILVTIINHTHGTCTDAAGTSQCSTWFSEGECIHNPSYMFTHCAIACKSTCLCSQYAPAGKTADRNCFCGYWAAIGHCATDPTVKDTTCQTSCNLVETVDCGQPPDVMNTDKTMYTTTWGSNATYMCQYGYDQTGGNLGLRYCNEDGAWKQIWYSDGPDPECTPWVCPLPPDVSGATVAVDNPALIFDTKATYTCNPGTEVTAGDEVHTCGNTTWVGTAPTCTAFVCGTPPNVEGATYSNTGNSYLDTTIYTCADTGAQLTGNGTLSCGVDKSWGTPPACASLTVTSPLVIYITVPLIVLFASGLILLAYYLFSFYTARREQPVKTRTNDNRVTDINSSQISLVSSA